MDEKPFGWRPLTDEQRASYAEQGFDDAAIAKFEESNAYRPNEDAVLGREFALALLDVVAKRHGPSVIDDFRRALQGKVSFLADSDVAEDIVEERILRQAVEERIDWDAIIDRASHPEHDRWKPLPPS